MNPADLFTKHLESRNKLDQVGGVFSCRFLDGRAAIGPTLKFYIAVHLAHDLVFLPHQHLPEDIARLFEEAVADPPRRGEDDDDPVEELSDPVPALQAIRRRMLVADVGRDPVPTTVTNKSRRKRDGQLSSDEGRSSLAH